MAEAEQNQSDTSEAESSEEEIEPKFKYKRIANDLETILNEDALTCCAVNSKCLIFGTFLGGVYLLDLQGNNNKAHMKSGNALFAHAVAVNYIDVDAKGEYVATCSDDGKVKITGLFSEEDNQSITFNKSLKAIALDPDIKATAGKRFIVGDDKLTMYEKGFLKKLKPSVLCTAEGYVLSICWNGQFVAWASYLGVRVYDLNEKCSLGLMKWEEPANARLDSFRCNFRWSNSNTLLIGWVDTIRICIIRKPNSIEAASRNLPGFIVDPVSTFQTTFYICGLAPLTSNQLVVLGYPKEKDDNHKALRPVLCVMDYKLNSSEEVITDSLTLRGYPEYSVNDYSLACILEEHKYFIVAPKDVVVATLYNTDDRVQWLTTHRKYEEALAVIETHGGQRSSLSVAKEYISYLLSLQKYDAAAKLCLRVLGNNKAQWEEQVYIFLKCQQLRSISAYLPTSDECKLDPHVYEMVLFEYLKFEPRGFLHLIKEWPPRLYNCSAVINAIQDNFRKECKMDLLEALAILYSHQGDYENALKMYLKLQNKDVFELIRRHNLHGVIHKLTIPLMQLDRERALSILMDIKNIPPEIVVEQLSQNQEYLYWYLDALNKVDKKGSFHWKLVGLYAKYDRTKLLPFLKKSNHYHIQEALDICKREKFYNEMVYLLGKMGNTIEALNIIIHKMKDIPMAIEFCKEHDDSDLWNLLIDESVENPSILTQLLDSIVGYINPVAVVNKIKLGQKIPNLRKSLTKMLWDFRLQLQLLTDAQDIQEDEYFDIHSELVQAQNQGQCILQDSRCDTCGRAVAGQKNIFLRDLVIFNCGHAYHEQCVPGRSSDEEYCKLCKIYGDDD